jgi:dienelactone hydrolase
MQRQHMFLVVFAILICTQITSVSAQAALVLPDLTGSYKVSRTSYDLTDPNREETFTADPDDKREIQVTVYYPADPTADATIAPYMTPALQKVSAAQSGVPYFLFNLAPHTYDSQPVVPGRFPVLIFSPGFGAETAYYTSLLEDIASHGYVIAALWHPYSLAVEFADGRLVPAGDLDSQVNDANIEKTAAVWATDAKFTLDTLEKLNQDDPLLAGHLDMDHVGAFGHSFGGAAAAEIAHDDTRVAAAIDMDGTLFGVVAQTGLTKPFMVMQAGSSDHNPHAELENAHPGLSFKLNGSEHTAYVTDLLTITKVYGALLPPGMVGAIDPDQAYTLIRTYVLAFFDQQIKGDDAGFLENPPSDPNVTLVVVSPQ